MTRIKREFSVNHHVHPACLTCRVSSLILGLAVGAFIVFMLMAGTAWGGDFRYHDNTCYESIRIPDTTNCGNSGVSGYFYYWKEVPCPDDPKPDKPCRTEFKWFDLCDTEMFGIYWETESRSGCSFWYRPGKMKYFSRGVWYCVVEVRAYNLGQLTTNGWELQEVYKGAQGIWMSRQVCEGDD